MIVISDNKPDKIIRKGRQKVLDKFMPNYDGHPLSSILFEKYRSSIDGNPVSVYRITPQEMTAKENSVETKASSVMIMK